MKNQKVLRLWPVVCAMVILHACQKEAPVTEQPLPVQNNNIKATGAIPDDPRLLAKIPRIVSSDFYALANAANRGGSSKKDSDRDGIGDATDACPTQAETMNGYQDQDGCPDTAPPPTATDSDGDGIADTADACPSQPETFNGFEDGDGCPDSEPTVVLPPTNLPSSYQLNMPPVGHQGSEGSCIAWATSYARSAEAYYRTNATSYSLSNNVFSPEYIYNQTKINSDCGSGTAFTITLDLLMNKGVSTWESMPYSSDNGCSLMPNSSQNAVAANYKIASYSTVYNNDITAIKTLIANNHPILTGISIDQNFRNAYPGYIWKSFSTASGDHGIVLCGYDDAKRAFKAINSWGTGWGDAGYIWIDYDFFPTVSSFFLYTMQ